jgi:hypothetical protein
LAGTKAGTDYALDNLRDSLDFVVGRDRFELHNGWFHSSAARDSPGGLAYQSNQRPQTCGLELSSENFAFSPHAGHSPAGEEFLVSPITLG